MTVHCVERIDFHEVFFVAARTSHDLIWRNFCLAFTIFWFLGCDEVDKANAR